MSEPYCGKPVSSENWLDEIGMTEIFHEIPKTIGVEGDEVRWARTNMHNRWMNDLVGEIINRIGDSVTVMWHSPHDDGYSHFGVYNVSELEFFQKC